MQLWAALAGHIALAFHKEGNRSAGLRARHSHIDALALSASAAAASAASASTASAGSAAVFSASTAAAASAAAAAAAASAAPAAAPAAPALPASSRARSDAESRSRRARASELGAPLVRPPRARACVVPRYRSAYGGAPEVGAAPGPLHPEAGATVRSTTPRYAVRTVRPRLARGWRRSGTVRPRG